MSKADRKKWDSRYAEGSYEARAYAAPLLVQWLEQLPGGRALDVACGAGRNALHLAGAGYRVDAMDISAVALERARRSAEERGLEVDWICTDLDTAALPVASYELVVVTRYLNRSLTERLIDSLKEGGHLLYEQHLLSEQPVDGPKSRSFRLQPNELLELFAPLRVLYYREGIMEERDGRTMALAQLVACRGSPGF